ncbi:hypothetical protein CHLRE_16g667100v5 [Chlamydomonas reinhardtii]|uniref:LysM domain-containing protein n=1 Tax=Chlamydomonas reinhardtii TaxID=3055 RepID=A0A2K3CUK1_CHLRE|nr:uncharacterized protein CHLRE_16g667100v5 [Chlamydomonas reinhardtii]PNW71954.1 hypothetical protein CHLRE_16g667100v5 [Chlamydomonas reinhardtii]
MLHWKPQSRREPLVTFWPKSKTNPQPPPNKGNDASQPEPAPPRLEHLSLELVLTCLEPRELAKCRVVCREWHEAATSPEVRRSCFMTHWRLGGLVGEPRNASLLDTATLGHFVSRHEVARGDSPTSLAVRYGVSVTAVKRLNNLISDHSLLSRSAVYIPVPNAACLAGAHVLFEYCRNACRELLVLVGEDEAAAAREAAKAAATAAASNAAEGEAEAENEGSSSRMQEASKLRDKLVALLGRSLHVDEHTARYYLAEAGWCPKKAVAMCEQDLAWESRAPGSSRRRRGPIRPVDD